MSERDKNRELLLSRGFSPEETENFLNTKVGYATLTLPPDKAIAILEALSEFALISAPVEVRFCFSTNRYDKVVSTAEAVSGQPAVGGPLKPGELLN